LSLCGAKPTNQETGWDMSGGGATEQQATAVPSLVSSSAAANEAGRRQLLALVKEISEHGCRPDDASLTGALAWGGALPSDPEGWTAMCRLLAALVTLPLTPAASAGARMPGAHPHHHHQWAEVMSRMLTRINALDIQLDRNTFAGIQKAVKLFSKLLSPSGSAAPQRALVAPSGTCPPDTLATRTAQCISCRRRLLLSLGSSCSRWWVSTTALALGAPSSLRTNMGCIRISTSSQDAEAT